MNNTSYKKLIFVATTPFAVNSFLALHLISLSKYYKVTLLVNTQSYPLLPVIKENVDIVHINFERGISPWKDLLSLLFLCLVFIKIRPYSVHSITPKAGLLAMLASFVTLVPNRIHTFTGQVWAVKNGFSRSALKFGDRVVAKLASHLFSDSVSQNEFLESEGIVKNGSIRCLGPGSISGVCLRRFRPSIVARLEMRNAMSLSDDVTVFLFVGRISRDKGIDDLINAFQRLAQSNANSVLWIVGPDEGGLSNYLKVELIASGLPVYWFGPTPHPEQYMRAADVLILPSYREGFGSVIIEAAACGIPTIAYEIYGVNDAVEHEVTGILTPVRDWKLLSDEMLKLSFDFQRRKRLGEAALFRAEKKYSDVLITKLWINFYNELLGAKKNDFVEST